MILKLTKSGNLKLKLQPHEKSEVKQIRDSAQNPLQAESRFIEDMLPDYQQVYPEDVGALTSATLIQNKKTEEVYGDMDYQVQSFIQALLDGKEVTFTSGGKPTPK